MSDARSQDGPESIQVAAIQMPAHDASKVDPSCTASDLNCAMVALIRRASRDGARLVVTPEYGLIQRRPERAPKIGELPSDAAKVPLLSRFSALAKELRLYLVLHLETIEKKKLHNTQVALAPTGEVVAVHHKFELFAAERLTHTAGSDVTFFDTPFGRVGLLVCADLYGDPRLHDELTDVVGASIIAVSAKWTVPRATRWQSAFARDWGVYVVAANSSGGQGKGGGVFDPQGNAVAIDESGQAAVSIASIPTQR